MSKIIQLSDGTESLFPRMANGSLTSSNAINDIKREGFYWCNNIGGKPHTNTYGFLVAWTYGSAVLQVYIPFIASGLVYVYLRCYVNDTWSVWRQLTTSAV